MLHGNTRSWIAGFLALTVASTSSAHAQCSRFDPAFGLPGPDAEVRIVRTLDLGNGPAVYLGGDFQAVGGIPANRIARFDGTDWAPLGAGFDASPLAFAVFDDGGGPALYAGGFFTTAGGVAASHIAKWNGSSWSALGSGLNGHVKALIVFDDGGGPALFAGGEFTTAGGGSAAYIAKWNGSTWSAVGGGMNFNVHDFVIHDDGSGPALFVAGAFVNAGGSPANRVAKWNGSVWATLGSGTNGFVNALTVYDDGAGPALYASGDFTSAGGTPASKVAKWDGSNWSALASGIVGSVDTACVFDDGSGPGLFVAGGFSAAGGAPAAHVAKWDGSTWTSLGSGLNTSAKSVAVFDAGGGDEIWTGGNFSSAGGVNARCLARWDGSVWTAAPHTPYGNGFLESPSHIVVYDDGGGPALHTVRYEMLRWEGSLWTPVGFGPQGGQVQALLAYDDGNGAVLCACGDFTSAGSVTARGIAVWDGSTWGSVGSGVPAFQTVASLGAFDDGSGPRLYAGGNFAAMDGVPASCIARWDGSSWSPLGSGTDNWVLAMAVFDDGTGPALYAGGAFTSAGGAPASRIAKWDGSTWTPLGTGTNGTVRALLVHDDGSGPALYVAGEFTTAGGAPANRIAKWSQSTWEPLGSGVNNTVFSLASFDDGAGGGAALYAGGQLSVAGGISARGIARWNGSSWAALGSGLSHFTSSGSAMDLVAFDFPSAGGPALYITGGIDRAGSVRSYSFAKWRGCTGPIASFCPGDGTLNACPCSNSGQIGHGCQNSAGTGGALLAASGTTSPDAVVLASSLELPNALSIFLQGNALLSGGVVFGDGMRCAGGSLKRLYVKSASGGAVSAPTGAEPSITARSAALGDTIAPGEARYYHTYYRDSNPTFCASPAGSTFNATNGVRILW